MDSKLPAAAACAVLVHSAAAFAQQDITRAGAQASMAGPAEFFTGRVALAPGCLAAVWFCLCILGLAAGMVLARAAWGGKDRRTAL